MFAECCIEIVVWNLRVDHHNHDYFLTSNVDIYSFFQGLIPGMKYSYHVQSGSNIIVMGLNSLLKEMMR